MNPQLVSATVKTEPRLASQVNPRLARFLSLDDFQAAAKRRLPRQIYGYFAGASERGDAYADNFASFAEFGFVPRALVDVSRRSASVRLFGRHYDAPFGIAPMGLSALSTFEGDIALAHAATAANIPSVLSATSLAPLEEVAVRGGATWFQAYLPGEDDRIEAMVDRVAAAGYETLVLTVDVPVPANRENNVRTGFSIPLKPSIRLALDGLSHPRWLFGVWARTFLKRGTPHFENMDAFRGPPILSASVVRAIGDRDRLIWRHVDAIRRRWRGNLVLKGILALEDARQASGHGVDGVIVSNHGGRQLDGAISSLRALPDIVANASGMAVMIDGGVRRGTDVLKALALGADFVFVGRPFLYAAAVAGEAGIAHAIYLLRDEIERDLALLGAATPEEVTRAMIKRRVPQNSPAATSTAPAQDLSAN